MLIDTSSGAQMVAHLQRLPGQSACRLQVAALPWRRVDGRVEVMLITSRDTGRWVLPKGWPEENESLSEAAAREAHEEAGLRGVIAVREAGRYFYAKGLRSGEAVPCEVRVFPLAVKQVAGKWKECRQRTRRWMSGEEAAAAVREQDLGALIAAFCAAQTRAAA